MVRSALPSSSPSRAFDVALFVCWIIHACRRHPLHVAFIVGMLVASIDCRVDWPSVAAMFGFPFPLGLAELSLDLVPVFKGNTLGAACIGALEGIVVLYPISGTKRSNTEW